MFIIHAIRIIQSHDTVRFTAPTMTAVKIKEAAPIIAATFNPVAIDIRQIIPTNTAVNIVHPTIFLYFIPLPPQLQDLPTLD